MKTHLLDRTDLAPAASHFSNACRASRQWSIVCAAAWRRAGLPDHAPHVSGIGHRSFPVVVQKKLRALAETVATETAAGYAARPPRVHERTVHRLAGAVASAVGSGFYGPQPL